MPFNISTYIYIFYVLLIRGLYAEHFLHLKETRLQKLQYVKLFEIWHLFYYFENWMSFGSIVVILSIVTLWLLSEVGLEANNI